MRKFDNLSLTSRIVIITAIVLIVCAMIAVGIYMYMGSQILGRVYEPDLIIPSPDGQHELVIREFSCLGGAGAEIYIRTPGQDKWYNSWMKKQIGTVGTDDYYQTFSGGTYDIKWESNTITINYYKGVPAENPNDPASWRGIMSYDLE